MAYNPNFVYGAPEAVLMRTLCLNDASLMLALDNKLTFRDMAAPIVPMLPCQVLNRESVIRYLTDGALDGGNQVVIQAPLSSGGENTFLVSGKTIHRVLTLLQENEKYIVTHYVPHNVPVNVHCVIFEGSHIILPPSVQIIVHANDRLLYRGADYITYTHFSNKRKYALWQSIDKLCGHLGTVGYRGVIGFDALITSDGVFIIEANNRFQGSSYTLNRALWESGLPSLQQLNLEAFGEAARISQAEPFATLAVPYSYFIFTNEAKGLHAKLVADKAHLVPEVCENSRDGYRPDQPAESDAYLYHLLFRTNISHVDTFDCSVYTHPALTTPSESWIHALTLAGLDQIKISLINQGLYLENSAVKYLTWEIGVRFDQRVNIDLILEQYFLISCPLSNKFTRISPFSLGYAENKGLYLCYYQNVLPFSVSYQAENELPIFLTSGAHCVKDIAFFSADRVRLQNSPACTFNRHKNPCRFCEVYTWDLDFTEDDIMETIDTCFAVPQLPFRHILIGGRSRARGEERDTILRMCQRIRRYSNIPIYLMCLPPQKLHDIRDYVDAGITEFGFNIEIFDREIAARIMPGKGKIPLGAYMDALSYAVRLCGRTGDVRTAFVVGLEPKESLLAGVDAVSRIGAAPILSAFRPVPHTPMANRCPWPSETLYAITVEASVTAERHGMKLGPSCIACQNNTLNVSLGGLTK